MNKEEIELSKELAALPCGLSGLGMKNKQVTKDTPPGTRVIVTSDIGLKQKTRTLSRPWVLGGELVVLLECVSGCYLASRCEVET